MNHFADTARVPRRDPRLLQELLPRVLAKVATSTQSGKILEPLWREAVGTGIAENTHPLRLEDACLWISVPTARWAAELELQAPALRERLALNLGPGVVKRLAFRVADRA